MKHLELQNETDGVRNFVLSLQSFAEEVVLDLHGNPVVQIVPLHNPASSYDVERLERAILARRDQSRESNADWESADLECWERI